MNLAMSTRTSEVVSSSVFSVEGINEKSVKVAVDIKHVLCGCVLSLGCRRFAVTEGADFPSQQEWLCEFFRSNVNYALEFVVEVKGVFGESPSLGSCQGSIWCNSVSSRRAFPLTVLR